MGAEGCCALVVGDLADGVAVLAGFLLVRVFFQWEGRSRVRARAAGGHRDAAQRPAGGRVDDVLLPVPDADGTVLHGAAVPVGLARLWALDTGVRLLPLSVTLLVAALGSRGLPDVSPRRVVRWGCSRCWRGAWSCWPGSTASAPESYRADAADRRSASAHWPRSSGSDGLGRARRAEPGGGRPAEHGDQPRSLAGDGTRRLDADRGADHIVSLNSRRTGGTGEVSQ